LVVAVAIAFEFRKTTLWLVLRVQTLTHFAVRILRGVLAAVAAIVVAFFDIVFVVAIAIAFVFRSTTLWLVVRVQTLTRFAVGMLRGV